MFDKIVASICVAALVAFLLLVAIYVNDIALWAVILIVLAMVAYELVLNLKEIDNQGGSGH